MQISHLHVSFRGLHGEQIRAVQGLSFTMFPGEIFCLLGHNGAGKSTTIGVLSGLTAPTAGDATVFGHSIAREMHRVRRSLGVCPQHDILWPELTCLEHMRLFARMRGGKSVSEGDVFCDLGSGSGKLVLAMALLRIGSNFDVV